jgi:DNA (cytosine-5)-methyltransferase 1
MANSESIRTRESRHLDKKKGTKGSYSAQLNSSGTELANTDSERGRRRQTWSEDAENVRQSSRSEEAFGWWNIEPDVGRVAHGVSDRTHRLKALGNSVIPHIPYYIAKSILEVEDA